MTQGDGKEERAIHSSSECGDMRASDTDRADREQIDGVETALLEPHIQEQLGRVLRSFCDDLIHQPIPDKFVVLLAQLEAKQREKK
jgi:hypothetical protein